MTPNPAPQLLRGAPYFPVADLERTAVHYEQVLGFRREYTGGTPPEFAVRDLEGYVLGFGQPVARPE